MPRLKPTTQAARRENILDASERCFARSGFHRTTMHDICAEAGVSPGALYVYFSSKEALIAGIAERDRARLQREIAELAAAPDLVTALGKLGERYTLEEPHYKRVLCVEIGLEATRNAEVGRIHASVDRFVVESFAKLFERAEREGRISPATPPAVLAEVIAVIGDGMFWRRAVDPSFDARRIMPAILALVASLLNPRPSDLPPQQDGPRAARDGSPPATAPEKIGAGS